MICGYYKICILNIKKTNAAVQVPNYTFSIELTRITHSDVLSKLNHMLQDNNIRDESIFLEML